MVSHLKSHAGGHRYMSDSDRAHRRYGKTTKTSHAGAPPPPAAAAMAPSGGAPPAPAPAPGGMTPGASPMDAMQAQAAAAMGQGNG